MWITNFYIPTNIFIAEINVFLCVSLLQGTNLKTEKRFFDNFSERFSYQQILVWSLPFFDPNLIQINEKESFGQE